MRIGYLRTSTTEQSPARQIDSLSAYCDVLNIEKISANQKTRPVFLATLRRLRTGDTFVIHDIDHGFRSALEALQVMHRLHQRGVSIDVLSLKISTTSPEGELMYTITAAYARYEWRCLSRRTKEGIAAARARGVRIGRPPVINDTLWREASKLIESGVPVAKAATQLGIGVSTLYRHSQASADPV